MTDHMYLKLEERQITRVVEDHDKRLQRGTSATVYIFRKCNHRRQ